jgi:hypothetical protein
MKMVFAMLVTLGSMAAQAQILATYSGSIQKISDNEFLAGEGTFTTVPSQCVSYVSKQSHGFSASTKGSLSQADIKCDQAEITVDLENSSFCQDQGGKEFYFPPTVVAVKCY